MDTAESPLEVLSRAATMVQSNILPPSYRQEGGGGKWRRSNKNRKPSQPQATAAAAPPPPPPKYPTTVEVDSSSSSSSSSTSSSKSPVVHSTTRLNGEPIDLSTRRIRGLPPPSYSETMAKQHIWLAQQNNKDVVVSSTTECRSQALCDPMIDEHFRRSLGQGYLSSEESSDTKPDSTLPTTTSLSVDDHFAKSLGERWLELQQEEEEEAAKQRSSNQRPLMTAADVPPV